MKRAITVFLFVAVAAIGYRFVQLIPYPLGSGQHLDSPDQRYQAHASTMIDEGFWGRSRHYYQFSIETSSGQSLKAMIVEAPENDRVDWRNEGKIDWAPDGSKVTYSCEYFSVGLVAPHRQHNNLVERTGTRG